MPIVKIGSIIVWDENDPEPCITCFDLMQYGVEKHYQKNSSCKECSSSNGACAYRKCDCEKPRKHLIKVTNVTSSHMYYIFLSSTFAKSFEGWEHFNFFTTLENVAANFEQGFYRIKKL